MRSLDGLAENISRLHGVECAFHCPQLVLTYRARMKEKLKVKDAIALLREAIRWVEANPRA